jgi:hypothetical protein
MLRVTPLTDILKDNMEKEKKKVPQFLYYPDKAKEGEDIGFEDNN